MVDDKKEVGNLRGRAAAGNDIRSMMNPARQFNSAVPRVMTRPIYSPRRHLLRLRLRSLCVCIANTCAGLSTCFVHGTLISQRKPPLRRGPIQLRLGLASSYTFPCGRKPT